MLHALSTSEAKQYRDNGFFIRRHVFQDHEIFKFIEAVEISVIEAKELAEKGKAYILDGKRFVDIDYLTVQFELKESTETIKVIEPANQLNRILDDLVRDIRIVNPIKKIIGSESIALWTNKLNLKSPKEGSGFGWHQDSPYWIHDCSHVDLLPNVYLALDDANRQNGCFRLINQSHLKGCLPGIDNATQLGGFYTNPDFFDLSDEVLMEVPAGSLVFFNPHIVHGSEPNESDKPRRAFIMTYQPANNPMLKSGLIDNIEV
jgi:hypothetical protein